MKDRALAMLVLWKSLGRLQMSGEVGKCATEFGFSLPPHHVKKKSTNARGFTPPPPLMYRTVRYLPGAYVPIPTKIPRRKGRKREAAHNYLTNLLIIIYSDNWPKQET